MKRFWSVAVCVAGVGLVAAPASAITNGGPDGNGHPFVGGLVSPTQYSDGTWIYCSGTLVAARVFVTAAHCGDDATRVKVTFDTAYVDGDTVYSGTFHTDPLYTHVQSDPHDLAVVELDRPVRQVQPAALPAEGSLAKLPAGQQFTSVGYGAYAVVQQRGGKAYLYDDVRGVATGTLSAVNPAWLRISMNPSRGDGGGCYGDSGGPNFLGDTNILAATTITGDAVCRAANVVYRLDTPAARDFLGGFVTLP